MKALVICPDRRPQVSFLCRNQPLVLTPFLGQSVLAHILTHLAATGVREVRLLASDRPDQIRAALRQEDSRGLQIELITESIELSVADARAKYGTNGNGWLPEDAPALVADHLPGFSVGPLFQEHSLWMSALKDALPIMGTSRVGVRELSPGIWVGLRSRIDPTAQLHPPCWIGESTWIRAGTVVGPDTYLEDRVLLDRESEVLSSWVGPDTYVGAMTRIEQSLAWGGGLLKWTTNSFIEIIDTFLLASLAHPPSARLRSPFYGRLAALFALFVTLPVWALARWRGIRLKQPHVVLKQSARPNSMGSASVREFTYCEYSLLHGLWRRRPQLWSIVRGDFTWVGNRPITAAQAALLETEFEQLWLAAPVGLFSLADAEQTQQEFDDEARIHASYYATQASPQMRRRILGRCLRQLAAQGSTVHPIRKQSDHTKS
jgi:hypothetical protein